MKAATDRAETPLVSVVIPVFNGEETVGRAIESTFRQTYPNIECVVVNDASTDRTSEILAGFGDRIRVITNESNRGTAGAYNVGTRAAKGEFVLLMASDCALADQGYVEGALEHFDDPRVAAVTGQGIFSDLTELGVVQRIFTVLNLLDVDEREQDLYEVSFVETRCDLFRKQVLEEIGYWFEGLYNSTEDQDISARIKQRGYRLLQDKRLKYTLDFGQTEDDLFKVLKKQYRYANGQAYIFLKHGLGHHLMTGSQENRRRRIVHRFGQIVFAPGLFAFGFASSLSPAAAVALVALVGWRSLFYALASRGWLRGRERLFCVFMGLAADVTYGVSFLSGLLLWKLRSQRLLSVGSAGDEAA